MKKIEMAVFITRQLFMNDDIDEYHWKVKDLMKLRKPVLVDFYEMAEKAKKSMDKLDTAVDNADAYEFDLDMKKKAAPKPKKIDAVEYEVWSGEKVTLKVGDVIHTSWGYNMTHNDFAKIVEISPTGKTVKAVMISNRKTNGGGFAGEETFAKDSVVSRPFRLKVKGGLRGSYPFCARFNDDGTFNDDSHKRFGYFSKVEDRETFYYNTMD